MKTNSLLGLVLVGAVAAVGCAGPAPSSSPSISPAGSATPGRVATPPNPTPTFRHGLAGLVDDPTDAGAEATVADSFDGQPLAVEQVTVCVGGEMVRVFSYSSEQERAAVASRIDPTDPTNIGTGIVEWDGWPKFWQRDRIIVVYLGRDQATIDVLSELMGDPFAQGENNPERLPGGC